MTRTDHPQDLTAVTGTFADIHALMFGPCQHDAHVRTRRLYLWLEHMTADSVARAAAVTEYAKLMGKQMREDRERARGNFLQAAE